MIVGIVIKVLDDTEVSPRVVISITKQRDKRLNNTRFALYFSCLRMSHHECMAMSHCWLLIIKCSWVIERKIYKTFYYFQDIPFVNQMDFSLSDKVTPKLR